MSVRSDCRFSRQDLTSSGVLSPATVIFSSRCDRSSSFRNMVGLGERQRYLSSFSHCARLLMSPDVRGTRQWLLHSLSRIATGKGRNVHLISTAASFEFDIPSFRHRRLLFSLCFDP